MEKDSLLCHNITIRKERAVIMKGYLSIGKVAKQKNVSIKSLRYYDEIGIFKPALTDHTTGYRYYKENQLYILDAISLCLELGIPLKNMSGYCDTNGNPICKSCWEMPNLSQRRKSVPCTAVWKLFRIP